MAWDIGADEFVTGDIVTLSGTIGTSSQASAATRILKEIQGSLGSTADIASGLSGATQLLAGTLSPIGSCAAALTGGEKTIWADSCSYADVSVAYALAEAEDTIMVPDGAANWATPLSISKAVKIIAETTGGVAITGTFTGSGQTEDESRYLFVYKPTGVSLSGNLPFRISGFSLAGTSSGILLSNLSTTVLNNIRIDHNNFNTASRPLYGWGTVYGCVDNNIFLRGVLGGHGTLAAWTDLGYEFGDANNLYFEDNVFGAPGTGGYADGMSDGGQAWRICYRHNTIYCNGQMMPLTDLHGNQSTATSACQGGEFYENTIINNTTQSINIVDLRGGKLIAFNNTTNTSNVNTRFTCSEEHLDSEGPGPANDVINGQPQHVSDSYFWGNRKGSGAVISGWLGASLHYDDLDRDVPLEDSDYWNEDASFDGSTGIGIGLLSARPESGLTVGVGYWATDTNTLYRATSSTEWETYYTPYAYPHPLRDEGPPPTDYLAGDIDAESSFVGVAKETREMGGALSSTSSFASIMWHWLDTTPLKRLREYQPYPIQGISGLAAKFLEGFLTTLAGTFAALAALTGISKIQREVAGTSDATSGIDGIGKRLRWIDSSIAGQAGLAGVAKRLRELIGSFASEGEAVAVAKIRKTLVGVSAAISSLAAEIGRTVKNLLAFVTGISGLASKIKRHRRIPGIFDASTTIAGIAKETRKVVGLSGGLAATSGVMKRGRGVAGTISAAGALSALGKIKKALASIIAGAASLAGLVTSTVLATWPIIHNAIARVRIWTANARDRIKTSTRN